MEQTVQSTKQWTETKEQRKARKAIEKAQKSAVNTESLPQESANTVQDKKYVVCLKWGDKYSAEYVNKLHSMVKRNCTLDHEFVCFTENTNGIDPEITTKPLPRHTPLTGWWYKPWFFSNELGLQGTLLFLDLDLIVFENIDKFFFYDEQKDFVIIRDFNRANRANWDRINSSVFRLKIGSRLDQYKTFINNRTNITRRMHGDQDWMYRYCAPYHYWPDEWVQSYKWEMRGRQHIGIVNGQRNFINDDPPTIPKDTSIAVFHGKPDIHLCSDSWPKKHWC